MKKIEYYIDAKGKMRSAKTHAILKGTIEGPKTHYVEVAKSSAAPKKPHPYAHKRVRDQELVHAAKVILKEHGAVAKGKNLKRLYKEEVFVGASHAGELYRHGGDWIKKKPHKK